MKNIDNKTEGPEEYLVYKSLIYLCLEKLLRKV